MLSQGYGSHKGSWWRPQAFEKLRAALPEWIIKRLEIWQASLLLLDQEILKLDKRAKARQSPLSKAAFKYVELVDKWFKARPNLLERANHDPLVRLQPLGDYAQAVILEGA